MLNYSNKPSNEFEPCTRIDKDVLIAVQSPDYIARHKQALKNF
jgi:hypothetical protein